MKKQTLLPLAALVLLLSSCNFSAGTKKDFGTGLSYDYNGFGIEEVFLVGPDNTPLTSNKVALNTEVAIVLQGISNYELKDGKAIPGLALSVTDSKGGFVLNEADLFANGEGYSAEDASILRGTVTVGSPMVSGETYHIKMHVWDKNKAESKITAEVDVVVE